MSTLFFDIETVPAASERHAVLRQLYAEKVAKAAARGQESTETFAEYLDRTALAGEFGRIVCIAYALDDTDPAVLQGEEEAILRDFWQIAKPVSLFVGHNVMEFDLPFIIKRSRVLGAAPSRVLSFARYRQDPIFDTMREWDLWSYQKHCSLHTLALALDLPTSKDGLDGSQVAQAYADGRLAEICEYCKKDVVLTRAVYRKMTFAKQPR